MIAPKPFCFFLGSNQVLDKIHERMNPPKEDDSNDGGNENNSLQRITIHKQEAKEWVSKSSKENGPFNDNFKDELENTMK